MPSLVTTLLTTCSLLSKSSAIDGSAPTCSVNTATNSFYIDSPFSSNTLPSWDFIVTTANSAMTMTINGATNPVSARDAGTWKVITHNKVLTSYYPVDTGSGSTSFTPVAGSLTASGSGVTSSVGTVYSDQS